jgi:hypothetical protein
MAKRLTTLLATIVLGTTLVGSGANAAVFTSATTTIAAIPADVAPIVSVDGDRPVKDGDHHRRFCAKLNTLLARLVDNGVITREQKLRIMDAFNCVPDPTTDPSTTRSTTAPVAAQ